MSGVTQKLAVVVLCVAHNHHLDEGPSSTLVIRSGTQPTLKIGVVVLCGGYRVWLQGWPLKVTGPHYRVSVYSVLQCCTVYALSERRLHRLSPVGATTS